MLSISQMAPYLAGGMKEQELAEIKLHGVSSTGLKNIIEFIYTSQLSLNLSTLQDTLEAASFLQVLPVLNFCNQLLSSEVCGFAQSFHNSETAASKSHIPQGCSVLFLKNHFFFF